MEPDDIPALAGRRRALGYTTILVVIVAGYVLLVAWGAGFLAWRLAGPLTLGLALGVVVALAAWVIAACYVRAAGAAR
jgi:uncharacterized membrane protein (DUF485 family)